MRNPLQVRVACAEPLATVVAGLVRRQMGIRLTGVGGDVVVLTSLSEQEPAQERGAAMEVRAHDGSREWAELYERALRGPVRDQR